MTQATWPNFRDTHNVPELLAPAGGPEPFNAALAGGADAIYCALGNDFNARRSATNFTYKTFEAACRAAHLAGARVYVTVNVVIATHEMPRVLALIRKAWLLGADAFIIQDWGLLAEVRRRFPQVECHVSTQANVHDARATAWCRDLGVGRVTLSRELSADEIARIAQEGVELESFGHGALCFCYSGVCMMSSLGGGRSANRGMCAQPCRLLYELVDGKGRALSAPGRERPLCPKDYCTFDDVARLAAAGLGSLKVEGRMKAPDYVYSVVSSYRAQLDDIARGHVPVAADDEARRERLRRAFNRGFTNGYLDGVSDDDMMSYDRSNNRGELVGMVVGSRDLGMGKVRRGGGNGGRERLRSKSYAEVTIRLDKHVGKGDLLEVRPDANPKQFLTTHAEHDAEAGETIVCRTVRPMAAGDPVRVIRSQAAMDEAARVSSGDERYKRAVDVRIVCRLGQPFVVELTCADGAATARAEGFVVEAARTKAVSGQDLIEHVGRMGQSPFVAASFDVEMDEGCGMGFSAVHGVRSEACERLAQELLRPYAPEAREPLLARVPDLEDIAAHLRFVRHAQGLDAAGEKRVDICALVPSVEVANVAVAAGATRLYATADVLVCAREAHQAWPEGVEVVPWLDEVCREPDHARLDPHVAAARPCAVGNVSELALAAERGAMPEVRPCIPVHNESALLALEEAGAKGFWFSPELTLDEMCALARSTAAPCGAIVSGRTRAMTSEHCVLQVADRCVHDCARCGIRRMHTALRDKDGALLPVRTDLQGRSRIYAARPLDATPEVGAMLEAGISRLMADCTLLAPREAAKAVERVARGVAAAKAGKKPAERLPGATTGHLYMAIG